MNDDTFVEISEAFSDHTAWRSRRYIPHFNRPNVIQMVTFRLEDAVPMKKLFQWEHELRVLRRTPANDPRQLALRKKIAKYEDAGHGSCWLSNEKVAAITQQAILFFDEKRYRVISWCIMPNHVHVIIEILENNRLEEILHSWKSFIAHEANKILRRSGAFWFPEYHDRFIRNSDHLQQAVDYVENNPVKAGLVAKKEEWKWSSASSWERGRPRPHR
jgi:putative transposase